MRLAVLSDIHGNLDALEAVLRDAHRRGAEGLIHLGDLVGYGPNPNEVVARIRSEDLTGVVGNYDLAVCHADLEQGKTLHLKPALSSTGAATYSWTRDHVTRETLAFLRTLPAQIRMEEGNLSFLFAHGSPERANEYLFADTPKERLRELFAGTGAQVLVVGHTHVANTTKLDDAHALVNPGSVGRPKDGDPRASYLILDTFSGLQIEHLRVEFDIESVVAESIRSGLPSDEAFALRLGRGI